MLLDEDQFVKTAVKAVGKMVVAGNMQGIKTARFISLLKQYMEQRWSAVDEAVDAEEASQQDACWDMSVLQSCLTEQRATWASLPSQSTASRDACGDTSSNQPAASRRHEAVKLLEQVNADWGC